MPKIEGQPTQWSNEKKGQTMIYKTLHRKLSCRMFPLFILTVRFVPFADGNIVIC
jgi:hypothetical protein